MTKHKTLSFTGRIVTAWPESPTGPGWSNRIVWVLVRHDDGRLEEIAIQPEDQTPEMIALFGVALAARDALTSAVVAATVKR